MSDYDIGKAFEEIENELIDSMMRNFSRHRAEETKEGYNWTQWQAEQLKALEEYRKTNAQKFGKQFKSINSKVEEMIHTARADGNAEQEVKILEAIKNGFTPHMPTGASTGEFFKVNNRKLNALVKSTTDDLKRAETAVLRMSNDKYRKAIFNAQVYANTGAGTYEKAVDMACKDMLNAGLNCVEYKNGARHTLSDYADMAIKTANKRAYLRGEGEERAKYGLSLVVVNSRQGGCPDCAKYIGKVFIDDVYSNGKKSDGDYPLLSTAIVEGLFHPRCKDSTSTHYPELDDLSGPLSDDELAELDRQRGLEVQQQHAEKQAERFDRRAKYSLDEDNKKFAKARADEWHDRADKLAEKVKNAEDISPKAVAKSQKAVIMKSEGVLDLEQAKKRDHKIYITDTAINKVDLVKPKDFSAAQASFMKKKHKELLSVAKSQNNSNEVLFIENLDFNNEVRILGDEFVVSPGKNPFAVSVIAHAERQSLVYLHNHPSTNTFSVGDIDTFICERAVKTMSVVTNQGEVYILNKLDNYNFNDTKKILTEIYKSYPDGDIDDKDFVKKFLKRCHEGGIEYAKSK